MERRKDEKKEGWREGRMGRMKEKEQKSRSTGVIYCMKKNLQCGLICGFNLFGRVN